MVRRFRRQRVRFGFPGNVDPLAVFAALGHDDNCFQIVAFVVRGERWRADPDLKEVVVSARARAVKIVNENEFARLVRSVNVLAERERVAVFPLIDELPDAELLNSSGFWASSFSLL